MKSFTCCDLKNEKVKAVLLPTPEVPDGLFKLHTLAAFIGCRGSGKTNACVLLAQRYLDEGVFNRVFIISPTFESNPQFETLKPDPNDVYKSIQGAIDDLNEILSKVKEDVDDYEKREEYKQVYLRWQRNVASMRDMNILEANDYRKPLNLPKPCPLLIIDDMSHSPLYQPSKKNPFINLCLRHRHLHRVGITIYMLVQTFTTGIPKCLRQNVQQYYLWPTHDMTQLEAMYHEFANLCSYEQFLAVFREATKEPHSFLSIDLNPTDETQRFRRNFDTALVLPKQTETSLKKRKRKGDLDSTEDPVVEDATVHDSRNRRP
jgi:hypothetical protein